MGVLTFDWGQIAYNTSPLPIPWWAMANVGVTIVFFFWFLLPILYVRPPCFSRLIDDLTFGVCSTATFGTVRTFPWCLRTLSITQGTNTTFPGSSMLMPPSTCRLTRNTAPSSFPRPLPFPMGSHLRPSLPPFPTPSSTTASRSGLRLVAPSPNNRISTPASCQCTRRSLIFGTLSYLVRPILLDTTSVLICFPATMFVFGVVAIEVWDTQFPVWAFVLALMICAFCLAFFRALSSRV